LHWIFGIIGAAPASVVAKVEIIFFSPFHFSRVLHNSRCRGCPDDPKDTNSICLENAKRWVKGSKGSLTTKTCPKTEESPNY
jgi:hypothetical protein